MPRQSSQANYHGYSRNPVTNGAANLLLQLLFTAISVILLSSRSVEANIAKRHVVEDFGPMIYDVTKCNPMDYLDHGCWCGMGNKDDSLEDGIDGCCKIHDICYGVVEARYTSCTPHWANYKWSYNKGGHEANCTDSQDTCAHHTCLCDRAAADCFRQYACPNGKKRQCSGAEAKANAAANSKPKRYWIPEEDAYYGDGPQQNDMYDAFIQRLNDVART